MFQCSARFDDRFESHCFLLKATVSSIFSKNFPQKKLKPSVSRHFLLLNFTLVVLFDLNKLSEHFQDFPEGRKLSTPVK